MYNYFVIRGHVVADLSSSLGKPRASLAMSSVMARSSACAQQHKIRFDTETIEGRGGEKGGSANLEANPTEPLTQEMPPALQYFTEALIKQTACTGCVAPSRLLFKVYATV